jgi:antitoxin (DNA-binding transcriptional repressor) of toxin-antitoxin stability system
MKTMTASDARKNWFRLLDEVLAGQTVVIERNGQRVVIQKQASRVSEVRTPDYASVLRAPGADDADKWGWSWSGSGALRSTKGRKA